MKYTEHSNTQQTSGNNNKGSLSTEPMCKLSDVTDKDFDRF
jgi:hypothetical protein